MRAQILWKVPIVSPFQPLLLGTASPTSRLMRSRISAAALLVKVTAMIARGCAPAVRSR
jgi:hypothetical protein